jgi:hypothetical protein
MLVLTLIGLLSDIAGASLLFFSGSKPASLDPGERLAEQMFQSDYLLSVERGLPEAKRTYTRKIRRQHLFHRCGISLLLFGFALQAAATVWQMAT